MSFFVSWSLRARFLGLGGVFPRSVGSAVTFNVGFVRVTWVCAPAGVYTGGSFLIQPACCRSLQESRSPDAGVCLAYRLYLLQTSGVLLSHLPTYFSDVNMLSMLDSPTVFADSLFREEDVARFLDATRSSSSLRLQQVMVDVASRPHRYNPCSCPNHSPERRRRRESDPPLDLSKRCALILRLLLLL